MPRTYPAPATRTCDRCGDTFETQAQVAQFVVDALFRDARVAVEFDGDYWHDLPRAQAKDRRKDAALRAAGYTVVRVRQTEYERDPAAFFARLADHCNAQTEEAA